MDAFIIIGKESAGKSSLIRSLSGVGTFDKRIMETTANAVFTLWARHSSLQEALITPAQFITEVQNENVGAALLALLPRSSTRTVPGRAKRVLFPDPYGYIRSFIAAGWNIQDIATINDPKISYLPPSLNVRNFTNSSAQPFNVFSASVRQYWHWR